MGTVSPEWLGTLPDERPSEVPTGAAALIRAARGLAPHVDAARARVDRERTLPGDLVDAPGCGGHVFALAAEIVGRS